MDRRRSIGQTGEQIAAEHLLREGYEIVERNFRKREGELDVIARGNGVLVFCEVKTLVARRRVASGPVDPLESIDRAKRMRLRRLARLWLADHRAPRASTADIRFDAIGVRLSADGRLLALEHVQDAF